MPMLTAPYSMTAALAGPYQDPHDTPCRIANDAPADWPDLPAWLALECRTDPLDWEEPPSGAQLWKLRTLGCTALPASKEEASAMIDRLLHPNRKRRKRGAA